jgi:glycosyltransferase involved in cell wall biosynthesis
LATRDITERPDVMRGFYANYSAAIAPTRFLRDAYVSNGLTVPLRESRFGVDAPRRPKPHRAPSLRMRFVYIGQIAPHKGISILLDAFSRLPQNAAILDIFGKEDQYPDYTTLLKKKAEGLAVRFCGTFPKERIYDVLEEADFLVIPSVWPENSPLVLLNSLASHTPVIISDVEGMTEFVQDGQNGFVFRRGSAAELERVLRKIIADPVQARAMSATTEYDRSVEDMGDDVLQVYASVVGREAVETSQSVRTAATAVTK